MANAPSRLKNIDGENVYPKKSDGPAISASLGLTTSFQDFITYTGTAAVQTGAWLDIGNVPAVDVTIAFTHGGTAAVFSLLPIFANLLDRTTEPTVGAPPPYIPPVSGTGVTPAYVNILTFDKAEWTTTNSPLSSASVKYMRGIVRSNGCRLVKFMGKADSATGSPSAVIYVSAGTAE